MRGRLLSAAAAVCALMSGQYALGADSHAVTWDSRSLLIDNTRTPIWSGEFHPFRLPSPDLWRDALQKMKAVGYNTVSLYFPWDFYSFAPGKYDFSGIRDIDRVLTIAEEEGLYVIARPGPYANAELTRGGFPGWLVTQKGKARTDDQAYLAAADEWLSQVDAIIARHQITRGGSVIAYQIENELLETTPAQSRYMQHLAQKVRSDGIAVPLFHNDIGRNGYWVPKSSTVDQTVPGPNDLYAFDTYPGGTCQADGKPGAPNVAPDFGWYGHGGAKGGSSASPNTPGFTAEFGGGWFDYWGSDGLYACTAQRLGSGYERVFYGTNIANGLMLHNIYMAVGGTSWGWQPGPIVYTSYDYGAGIDESLGLRDKVLTLKMLGQFVAATNRSLAGMQKGEAIVAYSTAIKLYHNVNPDDGTQLIVAMHNPSNAVSKDSFTFSLKTADGSYRIPQTGEIAINGQDAKMLLANFALGGSHLVYATSQLQTVLRRSEGDVALFYAPQGETGEIVLRYAAAPKVEILAGSVATNFDAAAGDLRLNYTHNGLLRVKISEGGKPPLLLLLATTEIGKTFWRAGEGNDAVLLRGASLLRKSHMNGTTLALEGDTLLQESLEIWAAQPVSALLWNGGARAFSSSPTGSLITDAVPAPSAVKLPDLWTASWRYQSGSPEAAKTFDDSTWRKADAKGTASPTKPLPGQPVLTADDYGFYNGDVWYRGHFEGVGSARQLELTYGGGGAGLMQLWLDGKFLGQHELPTGAERPQTLGTVKFGLPKEARQPGSHMLSVMVRNNSHNWDLFADDAHKEGRGLISAALGDVTGPRAAVPIAWKIKGMLSPVTDLARGPLNNGGLDGEIRGFHLPQFDDRAWSSRKPDAVPSKPGTYWLRTHFNLDLPKGDISLGLTFGDGKALRSERKYRVLIFVNGWNLGQYIAHVGPQRTFVLPQGIINAHGANTLALAVTSDGVPANRIEHIHLTVLRNARGGIAVSPLPNTLSQNEREP